MLPLYLLVSWGGGCLFVFDKHGHDDIGLLCGSISRGLIVTLPTSQVLSEVDNEVKSFPA